MKILIYILIILLSFKGFSQKKKLVFYNENEEEITKEIFFNTKDYSKNLDLYFENDSVQYGLLITRQKYGKLDKETFTELKNYLDELSGIKIDSTQNIVINYLTEFPKKEQNNKPKSKWNVLDKDYVIKLNDISSISHYWINSPRCDNLKYYHIKQINWLTDKDDVFKNLFFPYETRYGNYILIKPNGQYFYFLG